MTDGDRPTRVERPNADEMNAIRVHEHGGADELKYEAVSRPEPTDDELLIRVRATGVNPIDWMVREGYADDALDPSLPYIPGWDLSGIVETVGGDVSAFEPGDSVFGLVRMPDPGNTYAEYATVPAADVVLKPESLPHTAAASVPMGALTAWHALFEEGNLQEEQRVLVHAAAGGVGHFAVQFADYIGAHVIGTASGRNERYLRKLGVDEFVNYRDQRFETVVDGVDVLLDAIGDETLARSIDVVNEGGRLVTLPAPPSEKVIERARDERNATTHWFSVTPNATTLAKIRDLVDQGYVEPTVTDVWPLSEARTAHRESERGHVRGKLVLEIGRERTVG